MVGSGGDGGGAVEGDFSGKSTALLVGAPEGTALRTITLRVVGPNATKVAPYLHPIHLLCFRCRLREVRAGSSRGGLGVTHASHRRSCPNRLSYWSPSWSASCGACTIWCRVEG
jgi:hypothetical protein